MEQGIISLKPSAPQPEQWRIAIYCAISSTGCGALGDYWAFCTNRWQRVSVAFCPSRCSELQQPQHLLPLGLCRGTTTDLTPQLQRSQLHDATHAPSPLNVSLWQKAPPLFLRLHATFPLQASCQAVLSPLHKCRLLLPCWRGYPLLQNVVHTF